MQQHDGLRGVKVVGILDPNSTRWATVVVEQQGWYVRLPARLHSGITGNQDTVSYRKAKCLRELTDVEADVV